MYVLVSTLYYFLAIFCFKIIGLKKVKNCFKIVQKNSKKIYDRNDRNKITYKIYISLTHATGNKSCTSILNSLIQVHFVSFLNCHSHT